MSVVLLLLVAFFNALLRVVCGALPFNGIATVVLGGCIVSKCWLRRALFILEVLSALEGGG